MGPRGVLYLLIAACFAVNGVFCFEPTDCEECVGCIIKKLWEGLHKLLQESKERHDKVGKFLGDILIEKDSHPSTELKPSTAFEGSTESEAKKELETSTENHSGGDTKENDAETKKDDAKEADTKKDDVGKDSEGKDDVGKDNEGKVDGEQDDVNRKEVQFVDGTDRTNGWSQVASPEYNKSNYVVFRGENNFKVSFEAPPSAKFAVTGKQSFYLLQNKHSGLYYLAKPQMVGNNIIDTYKVQELSHWAYEKKSYGKDSLSEVNHSAIKNDSSTGNGASIVSDSFDVDASPSKVNGSFSDVNDSFSKVESSSSIVPYVVVELWLYPRYETSKYYFTDDEDGPKEVLHFDQEDGSDREISILTSETVMFSVEEYYVVVFMGELFFVPVNQPLRGSLVAYRYKMRTYYDVEYYNLLRM